MHDDRSSGSRYDVCVNVCMIAYSTFAFEPAAYDCVALEILPMKCASLNAYLGVLSPGIYGMRKRKRDHGDTISLMRLTVQQTLSGSEPRHAGVGGEGLAREQGVARQTEVYAGQRM